MVVDITIRGQFENEVLTFAKLIANGAKANYTLKDVENKYYKEYRRSLNKYVAPENVKRRIAKETLQQDLRSALTTIQNEGRI